MVEVFDLIFNMVRRNYYTRSSTKFFIHVQSFNPISAGVVRTPIHAKRVGGQKCATHLTFQTPNEIETWYG